jgi:phosphohistidine swiveling domain-containing protein/predicted lactoylglutathione lyase
MNINKLKKYIDYNAMYDMAVMEPYMMSFKKLGEIIGASESTVLMVEKAENDVTLDNFNYKGKIITYHNTSEIEKVGKQLFTFLTDDEKWSLLVQKFTEYQNELEPVMNIKQTKKIIEDAKEQNSYLNVYTKYYNLYLELITIYLITDGRYHEFSVGEIKAHKIDQDIIIRLTTSDKQSSFQAANYELSELGKLYRGQKLWQDKFDSFLDKYVWFYLADTHYDLGSIVEELKKKLLIDQTIPEIFKEDVTDIELNTDDRKILERIAELGFQRMELRRYWQWIDYTLHNLLYTFAKQNKMPEKTLVFLSEKEVISMLSGINDNLSHDLVMKAQERSKNFAVLLNKGKISIYDDQLEIRKIKDEFVSKDELIKLIKGNVSYRNENQGKIVGTARVVTWSKNIIDELARISSGEILVVTQTKPDFLPYLKKVKAIVADEGGITSHVSVLSRELKIPAIVGTRIGTDSIKTGDILELDMLKGEVNIVSQS